MIAYIDNCSKVVHHQTIKNFGAIIGSATDQQLTKTPIVNGAEVNLRLCFERA